MSGKGSCAKDRYSRSTKRKVRITGIFDPVPCHRRLVSVHVSAVLFIEMMATKPEVPL